MPRRILVILGHPAQARPSFCEKVALTYKEGAEAAGHAVEVVKVAELKFDPILHEGYKGEQSPEEDIKILQRKISDAEHIVFVYPLWQFMIPALLKGVLERTLTPGFAYALTATNPLRAGLLQGKSSRLIQTMGMPALVYRLFFGAHGAKALAGILRFCGIGPIRITYFGMIEDPKGHRHERYLNTAHSLGNGGY